MSILAQCPICKKKISPKNKICPCGQDMDKAKKNGRVIYYISYRLPGGEQRREKIGTSYKDAVASDGKRCSQITEGKVLEITKDKNITFTQLAKWFEEQPTIQKKKYYKVLMIHIRTFCTIYGDRTIYSINVLDLKNYQIMRKEKGLSDSYIDQEIGAARNMLNVAWEGDKISVEALTPFMRVKKLLKPNGNARDIIISFEDLNRIVTALPKHARDIVQTAFHTGMRRGEVVNLTWDRVNLIERKIILEADQTKTGERREIPINDSLYKILNDIPMSLHDDQYVFLYKSFPVKDIRSSLKKACLKVGLPYGRNVKGGITFHDLRHTFNTNMRKAGVHETIIMDITGHKTRAMFDRYNTVDKAEKLEGTKAMERSLVDQTVDQK